MGAISSENVNLPVELLFLSKEEVEGLITYKEAVEVEDETYKACGSGQVVQPQKEPMFIGPHEDNNILIAMAVHMKNIGVAGIKWCPDYMGKQKPGVPTIWGAVVVLNRPETGIPFAIMDGTSITNIRTGTHSAIAGKYLAKKNSKTITIFGCGAQGRTQLAAFRELFPLEVVKVFDRKPEAMATYKKEMEELFPVKVIPAASAKEACEGTDIISMATTATKPIVMEPWVPAGCFVAGITGFADLDPACSEKFDKWAVGNRASDQHLHETSADPSPVDFSKAYAEVGEIAVGAKPGRENDQERIVYTHAGMGAHDIALANFVYEKALKQKIGSKIKLI